MMGFRRKSDHCAHSRGYVIEDLVDAELSGSSKRGAPTLTRVRIRAAEERDPVEGLARRPSPRGADRARSRLPTGHPSPNVSLI